MQNLSSSQGEFWVARSSIKSFRFLYLHLVMQLNRYDKLMTRKALESLPNFRWCLGPNCSSGQIHRMGNAEPIMICNSCGFRMCFVHQIPWHRNGISCAEWDLLAGDEKSQDAASAKLLKEITKACPSPSCGWRIQKIDGCDQMTCE